MLEYLNARIDQLARDHRSGAAEIVENIGNLLIDIAREGGQHPDQCEQLLRRAIRRLAQGQPSMAPVLNFLNLACLARDKAESDWETFRGAMEELVRRREQQFADMEARVKELPRVNDTLMIYSNSSTVFQIVSACRELGWPRRVITSEARPVNEGLLMAHKLKAAGIPVTVYTDAALMSRIAEAGSVWVGGDAVSHQGLVNKVGSRALAMLSKVVGIPFISLMSTNKLLSPDMLLFFRMLPQNPREIAADDADVLDVVNEYYEIIPLDLVTFIYTELGLSKPDDLVRQITPEPVSPLMPKLAAS
jgi:translation initiation factor 2B subunit (eIF-2B alpha/beta/delta family)